MQDPIHFLKNQRKLRNRPPQGFSLIVTITMMILLSLIAVGILSLSSITLRASSAGSAQAEARSNARMAAMMAVAQLQELSGADTRITASSKVIDSSNPENSGVWKSWEGNDRDSEGIPIAPDYDLKLQAGDPTEFEASQGGRFLGWLNSAQIGNQPNANQVTGVSTTGTDGQIKMISTGTVGTSGEEVYIQPTEISSTDGTSAGSIAWWTTGDQTKAYLNFDEEENAQSPAEWQRRLRANRLPDPDVFGLGELESRSAENSILPSRKTLETLGTDVDLTNNYFDFATQNRGLLTNVATGGWRKDLSLLSENYDRFSTRGGLPLFAPRPGDELSFNRITESSRPDNALMYHWMDDVSITGGNNTWQRFPPIASWSSLVDYMKQYEDVRETQNGLSIGVQAGSIGAPQGPGFYLFHDAPRRHPQVARIQWVLSLGSQITGSGRLAQLSPGLVLTPIITLWNPYNTSLDVNQVVMNFDEVFPLRIEYEVGGMVTDAPLRDIINNRINVAINVGGSLAPGEARIFSVNNPTLTENDGNNVINLTQGYTPQGGVIFTNLETPSRLSSLTSFSIRSVQVSATNLEGAGNVDGVGIRFHTSTTGVQGTQQIVVMSYQKDALGDPNTFEALYPSINTSFGVTLGEVQSNPRAFTTASAGLRGISPPTPSDDPRFQFLHTKGLLQNNPLLQYTEVGKGHDNDVNAVSSSVDKTGILHTVNAPFEFYFSDLNGWNDDRLDVDFNFNNNRTYIGSGSTADEGVTRCVVAEIPTAPLQSLADLQHFDVRKSNPFPPFQFNIIGNSSAHPIFPQDAATVRTNSFNGILNDDGYVLNNVLFDDWFLSSIAPTFRNHSGSQEMGMQQLAESFFSNEAELPNRFYTPANGTNDEPDELASELVSVRQDDDTDLYAYQYAASLLEVEGMFNINSVSVDAWRAVLMQGRDLQVPYLNSQGNVEVQQSNGVPFPRSTVAGDTATSDGGDAAVGGYATFDDATIEALAEEIVDQVRERGPFLSLAEFVNRQLSDDTNLALAGTIQGALDSLANGSGATNPYEELQNRPGATDITSPPPGNHQYQFPEAAMGSSNFGLPGWVRQADVLRSLAPIMSARDDTFTIRAYGDSRSTSGQIEATAWCELVVQRRAELVDASESSQLSTASNELTSEANQRFGRRYSVVSFRWLNEDEV